MAKFDAKLALEGKPVKLRDGLKAYVDTCDLEAMYVYGGYVDNDNRDRKTWTKEGNEHQKSTSAGDIVAMWEDQESETKPEVEENIFEKALKEKLPLRYTTLVDNNNAFYCIAKTQDGDYILERETDCDVYVTKLSKFTPDLEWYIVVPKLPKAFIPKEDEEFWFISPTVNTTIAKDTFSDDHVFYRGVVKAGLAFKTQKEAEDALRFLRSNIEVNHGKEQK